MTRRTYFKNAAISSVYVVMSTSSSHASVLSADNQLLSFPTGRCICILETAVRDVTQPAHVHSLHYVCATEVQQCSVQQVSESGSSRWTWPCTKPVQGVTSVVTTQSYSLRNTLQRHANITDNYRVFRSVVTKKLRFFSFC